MLPRCGPGDRPGRRPGRSAFRRQTGPPGPGDVSTRAVQASLECRGSRRLEQRPAGDGPSAILRRTGSCYIRWAPGETGGGRPGQERHAKGTGSEVGLKLAGVAKSADARDLKSLGSNLPCGFKSHPRHSSSGYFACCACSGSLAALVTANPTPGIQAARSGSELWQRWARARRPAW